MVIKFTKWDLPLTGNHMKLFSFLVCDILLSAVQIAVLVCNFIFFVFIRPKKTKREKNAVFIVPGSSIEDIHRKFGTLLPCAEDNPGCFNKTHRIAWGRINCRISLNDRYSIEEVSVSPFYLHGMLKIINKTLREIRESRSYLIHAKDPYFCGLLALIAAKISKTEFVISIHNDMYKHNNIKYSNRANSIFYRKIESLCYKECKQILLISNYLSYLVPACYQHKIADFSHGVSYSEREQGFNWVKCFLNLPSDLLNKIDSLVLFWGRFDEEKYIEDVFSVFSEISKMHPNSLQVMAGNGSYYNLLNEKNKNKNLIMPGFIDRNSLIRLANIGTAAFIPLGGFSLIEACASALPVVVYDVEWHREVVFHDKTGFIVSERDTSKATQFLSFLLKNKDRAREMGIAGKKMTQYRYDLNASNQRKCSLYNAMYR